MVDWKTVELFGLSLKGVASAASYGEPSLKVGKALVARHRIADNSIVLKSVDHDERDVLIEAQPDVYFLEDHYQGYDIVLARLGHASLEDIAPFIERTWSSLHRPKRVKAGKQSTNT